MENPIYIGIVENIALLIAIAVLYDFIWLKNNEKRKLLLQSILGIFIGLIGVLLMKNPWTLIDGIVFDTRSILLTISGLFFGGVSTVVAMLITAMYRIYMGGGGIYMGVAVIVSSSLISILWRKWRPQVLTNRRLWEIYLVAFLVHLVMLCCTVFLPENHRIETLKTIWLPVMLLYPAATVLIAMLLFQRKKNWKNKTLLAESEEKYRLLFDNSPNPMYIYDMQTLKFLEVNLAAIDKYGYTREEFLSMTIKDIRPKEDLHKLLEYLKKQNDVYQKSGNWRHLKKNGEIIYVQIASHRINYDGKPARHVIVNDVTELVKSHEIISQKEKEFREIFDSSLDSIQIDDIDTGKIIDCNEETLWMYGFTKEEILAGNIGDLSANIPPFDEDSAQELIKKAIAGEPQDFEWLARRKNGETFWVNVRLKLVEIAGSQRIMAIVRDITDKKISELKLKESEDRFLQVMYRSKDAIGILDENVRFIDCNDAAAQLHGFESRQELLKLSPHPSQLSPEFQPRGESSYDLANAMIKIALEQGSNRFEWLHKTIDGKNFWAEVSLTPIVFNGQTAIYAVWRDITERKFSQEKIIQSEREFREIFNTISEAILLYNIHDRTIVDCNNRAVEMYGYSNKNEMLACTAESLSANVEPYTNDRIGIHFQKATVEGTQRFDWIAKRKNGEHFWIEVNLRCTTIGGVDRELAVIRDITERKKFENDLMQAKEKAEESDRLKSAFLMNLSHEIRTPLNAILGFSELLRTNIPTEKQLDYINIIYTSGKRLLSIINETLEIALIDTNSVTVVSEEFELEPFLKEIIDEYSLRTKSKGLMFEIIFQTPNWLINTDRFKLHKILENILNNAITFTPEGKITVSCYLKEENLHFEIRDTGVGIDPNELPMIFKRFYRVHSDISIIHGGIGLGLPIAKAYIEMLGGELTIQSEINQGTIVSVSLPIIIQRNDGAQHPTKEDILHGNQQSILIVENESGYRQFVQNELTKANYKTITVSSFEEALPIVSTNQPIDVMLLRVNNVAEGCAQLKRIRELHPNVRILALATNLMQVDIKHLLKNGFDDVLLTPLNSYILRKTVYENLMN